MERSESYRALLLDATRDDLESGLVEYEGVPAQEPPHSKHEAPMPPLRPHSPLRLGRRPDPDDPEYGPRETLALCGLFVCGFFVGAVVIALFGVARLDCTLLEKIP